MIWFIMIATGLFTFATRFCMLNKTVGKQLPTWLVEALSFVPIAVLTAIIVPAVLFVLRPLIELTWAVSVRS